MAKLFKLPPFGAQTLHPALLAPLNPDAQHIILLVVDALGFNLFNRLMHGGHADFFKQRLSEAVYAPITSVCPSTTSSALTALWTGAAPATHGIIGYEMWAKEYGMVINTIQHSAISYAGDAGGLARANFEPRSFMNTPTFGTHLLANGVKAYAFLHNSIANSGLSTMQLADVDVMPFIDDADLWLNLRHTINKTNHARAYYYVYYSDIDTLSHRYSSADERICLQFGSFCRMIETALAGLTAEKRKNTQLILTADHGSIYTPKHRRFHLLENHAPLMSMLALPPVCENRLAFLFVRHGQLQAVQAYFANTWGDLFTLLPSETALEAGLFGAKPWKQNTPERIGDLIVIAREDAYLWWAAKPNHMLGRHGGLSADEMLVPFYAVNLG